MSTVEEGENLLAHLGDGMDNAKLDINDEISASNLDLFESYFFDVAGQPISSRSLSLTSRAERPPMFSGRRSQESDGEGISQSEIDALFDYLCSEAHASA